MKETYKTKIDYTSVIYLNSHHLDFEGGRFFFRNQEDNTTLSFEPRRARLLLYSSGGENANYVERVLSGVSYTLTIPFRAA